ncbi:MAG: MMPL family transporter [Oscillospiraceae bacterium]|nr:MMPL family transporter [Oscillospiraceae bacterium]
MSKNTGTTSFFEKLATFIVDKRNLIFFLYVCALIFCLFSRSWVRVCNDITEYLPDTTETRQGLTLMEEEFTTFATARVMVSHVTYEMAEDLAEQMGQIEGVSSAAFGSGDAGADAEEDSEPETPEDIAEYFKGADALISVTFEGEEEDEVSLAALSSIRDLLAPYDFYIDSAVGNSQAASLANEMGIILAVAAVIIVLVLLLTSRSYAEIPVLLLTFVAAAVLNLGTNFIFGEISFVSNSVTVVLQLALAIDYAIIMLHRFLEEREYAGDREACIAAVSASIPSISASSLTTISGLAAMMFMQFQIGFDMGIVLIKAILFSMLSVFTLMPGLLMLFSKAMEKTRHRSFIPKIDRWGKLTLKLRYVGAPLFVVAVVAGFLLSNQCPYVYGYSQIETARQNETQIAERRVNETFGTQNVMALIVPKGDYASEKALLDRLESYDQVDYAMGLSNVEVTDGYTLTDSLTPRQFSEMTDLDYDLVCLLYTAYAAEGEEYGRIVGGLNDYAVPLMDMFFFAYDKAEEGYVNLDEEQQADLDDLYQQLSDARKQLLGDTYTRMLISLDLPEEGEETFSFLQTIHREAERYYGADHVYLVGDSTSDYDLSVSFARDNVMISVLSVVFVIIVLLFTFQSVGLPLLLILVIQGSIWINFSFPGITRQPIFFMSYLVVTSIQMGANIDYAIVISSWYNELKGNMSRREAIIQALDLSFPTVLTSGSILSAAGFLIGRITTEPAIVGIGVCLCRGTLISMFLVMFILPQILFLGDQVVERTRFNLKVPEVSRTVHGTVYVNGRVRGRISGVVDAHIQGVIYGDVSGMLETGNYQTKEASNDNETEDQ